jgi:hypothetical protein
LCGRGCNLPATVWNQSPGAVPSRQDRCRGHSLVNAIRKEDGQVRRIVKEKSRCQERTREKLVREERTSQLRASPRRIRQRQSKIRRSDRQIYIARRRFEVEIRQSRRPPSHPL